MLSASSTSSTILNLSIKMIILVIGNIKHLNHTPYSQEAVHVHISARLVSIYCPQSCKNEITSNIEYN